MDWPRFQVDIGTMMIVVAFAAVILAIIIYLPPWIALAVVPLGVRLVVTRHFRERCRSEGRAFSEADHPAASRLCLWATLLIICLVWSVGLAYERMHR